MVFSTTQQSFLCLLLAVDSIYAQTFPRQTLYRRDANKTSSPTITKSSSLPGPTCHSDCTIRLPMFGKWYWAPVQNVRNFTHATVIQIVNTDSNTTRYSTKFNKVPDSISIPLRNSAGTRIATRLIDGSTSVTVTYPSAYYWYANSYSWWGTGQITSSETTTCATVSTIGSVVTFKSHPPFVRPSPYYYTDRGEKNFDPICHSSLTSAYRKDPKTSLTPCRFLPGGHEVPEDGNADGTNFELIAPYEMDLNDWELFPELAQFFNCTIVIASPPNAVQSVAVLTVESVSYEQDGKSTSSVIAAPVKNTKSSKEASTNTKDKPTPTSAKGSVSTKAAGKSSSVSAATGTRPSSPVSSAAPIALTLVIPSPITTSVVSGHTTVTPGSIGSGSTSTTVGTDSASTSSTTTTTAQLAVIIGSNTFTPNSASDYIIFNRTLTQGGTITLGTGNSTTVLALTTDSASDTILLYGSTSLTLLSDTASPTESAAASSADVDIDSTSSASPITSSEDVGGYIITGLGGTSPSSTTTARANGAIVRSNIRSSWPLTPPLLLTLLYHIVA